MELSYGGSVDTIKSTYKVILGVLILAVSIIGSYKYQVYRFNKRVDYVKAQFNGYLSHVDQEREQLVKYVKFYQSEVERLQDLLKTQIVNDEEILRAAREGKIEKANRLRNKLIESRKSFWDVKASTPK